MSPSELEALLEELEIKASLIKVSLQYHKEILEDLSTKLDNRIFEQMVRLNGLE